MRGEALAAGWAEGRLVGGSLTVCVASLGTPWEIDTRGAIVLFEDITELPYRVDRMLQQLRAAGKFEGVAGIALGGFTDCDDERYPEITIERLFDEIFGTLGVPVVTGLPFGHLDDNRPWPVGGRAALDGARGELEILESAVTTR